MSNYQIVLTRPDNSFVSGVSTQVSTAPSVWDEFLAIQLSPATRRSYAAALKDFFQREMGTVVSPEAIGSFRGCYRIRVKTCKMGIKALLGADSMCHFRSGKHWNGKTS
jgi:hypothetical protein